MKRNVYLDYAATSFVSNEVLTEMLPLFGTTFANPNSSHHFGREALSFVDKARDRVANAINAEPTEIYFTSGGTEANNWALMGIALANKAKGNHIVTSQIEHHSVLDTCKKLETMGFRVTYLPVDSKGLVNIAELLHVINEKTILVSVMTANNEIGTIQNISAISKIAHERNVLFHTDAVQAIGAVPLDVKNIGIDALTMSAHKIYGPKGCGALYVRKGVRIENLINGGNQENGKRGGTLNVPAIVGFGKAIELACRDCTINNKKIKTLKEYLINKIKQEIDDITINGHPYQTLPGVVNISFNFVEGESLMLLLDFEGIAVSTGSACSAGNNETSHVLTAIGLPKAIAQGGIRFSIGKSTTKDEIDYVVEVLKAKVKKLREISPLNKKSNLGGNAVCTQTK